jgi:V8-like Glu-specific endopeptidase
MRVLDAQDIARRRERLAIFKAVSSVMRGVRERFAWMARVVVIIMMWSLIAVGAVAAFPGAGTYLPADEQDLPVMQASLSTLGEAPLGTDATAMVQYDVATGLVTCVPSVDPSQRSLVTGMTHTSPYVGSLGGIDDRTVFPPDDRVHITDTTVYPWRTVCSLIVTFPDGSKFIGSGAIVGDDCDHGNHVLTAGHMVHSQDHGGWASSVKVIPGRDGAYMPYGYTWVTYMRSYRGWTDYQDPGHDWALLTLQYDYASLGWMGRATATASSDVYTGMLNTAGYPGDNGGDDLYWTADSGHSADEYNHWYWLDSYGGQSGSPVWIYYSSSGNRYILTTHAYEYTNHTDPNFGTRLNQDKFDRIITWMAEDGCGDPCTYSISPSSGAFSYTGGSDDVSVTTQSGCQWTAQSNKSWIHITSGSSGNGNGTVYYSVDANSSTSSRSGTMTIAGKTFTVNQEEAPCTYSISPGGRNFSYTGGSDDVSVTTQSGCQWTAQSNKSWIGITSGSSGTGNGKVYYSVDANSSTSSRSGTMTIAGKTFTVNQEEAPACTYSISLSSHSFSASGGSYAFDVTTSRSDCAWTAQKDASWITITSGGSGPGSKTLHYQVAANTGSQRTGHITIESSTHTVTQDGNECPPCTPGSPSPANNATNVDAQNTRLEWSCAGGNGADSYDVYFGTTSNPGRIAQDISTRYLQFSSDLDYTKTYYWKIVAKKTGCDDVSSDAWHFKTGGDQAVAVRVSAPDEVMVDADFVVKVDIAQVTDLDACQYDITFDPRVLRLDDVTAGEVDSTGIPVDVFNELSSGTWRIVQNVPGLDGVSGSGYLAELHFHVIGQAGDTSDINLSNGVLSDNQAQQIPATWTGLSVTITDCTPGDANNDGTVNALDITKVERIIVGLDSATPGADCNQDSTVNALDITCVERTIAGLSIPGAMTPKPSSVTVSIDAPSQSAADSDFVAKVNIAQVTDLDACQYDITFDPTVLRLDDVTAGNVNSTGIPVDIFNELASGTWRIVQNVPGLSGVSGSGYLAGLHFYVIGQVGDNSDIGLSNGVLSNNQAQEIPADWADGSISITGETGLHVHVQDAQGNPIEGAWAFAMTHSGDGIPDCEWGDEAGTDASGDVTLDVEAGNYTLVVSNGGGTNFLVVREGVSAPGSVTVDPAGTVLVNLSAKKVDGSLLRNGAVHIQPFCWAKVVGNTGETGSCELLVTPGVYNVFVWWGDPYYLYRQNVDLTASSSIMMDASQMDVGSLNVSVATPERFSHADVTFWPGFVWTSPCIGVHPSETIYLNAGSYDMGGCLFVADGDGEWHFRFDLDEVVIYPNDSTGIDMGGDLALTTTADNRPYDPGDTVYVFNSLTDSYGHQLTSAHNTLQKAVSADTKKTITYSEERQRNQLVSRDYNGVFPKLMVVDPLGTVVYESVDDWSAWGREHSFQLASDAPTGTYTITLSLNTGPLQGVVSDTATFCVGGDCGGTNCWDAGAIRIQANGSGTDPQNWFGVDPSGADCIDAMDIPEPPTSPAPYTSLWFELDASCSDTSKHTKDIKPSIACDESRTWTMKVADEGSAQDVTLTWDLSSIQLGDCLRSITLTDLTSGAVTNMRASATYTYTKQSDPETRAFTITVNCTSCQEVSTDLSPTGWHMATIPGELCGACGADMAGFGDLCCALCDDLEPCFIFRYDPDTSGYVMVPSAEDCSAIDYQSGMGFWARTYQDPVSINADVEANTAKTYIPVKAGWNQIGNPFDFQVGISAMTVKYQGDEVSLQQAQENGWISVYLFGYDTAVGGYGMLDPVNGQLDAWTGYWIRAYVDCELGISPIPVPPPPPTQNALLKPSALGLHGIEMPPSPPNFVKQLTEDVVSQLEVTNIPNPIRSEHTTTFKVEGKAAQLVKAIRVEIYNQAGQKVFTQDINAKELEWHTDNGSGELLANGVYLYQVWVNIGGSWYPTGVHKLAVVR